MDHSPSYEECQEELRDSTEVETAGSFHHAQVATVRDFVYWYGTDRRNTIELHGKRNGNSATFLEDGDVDSIVPGCVLDPDRLEVLSPGPTGADKAGVLDIKAHCTLEINDSFPTTAGWKEATDGIVDVQ